MLAGVFFGVALLGASGMAGQRINEPEAVSHLDTLAVEDCSKCLVITEQAQPSIRIVETLDGNTIWEWRPDQASELENPEWFSSPDEAKPVRSEEHTSELQSLMRISYAVFCLTKKHTQL